ncbi:MAG: class I SAM-dependent rRNA methyltransferase, partial [Candidatus Omnitrophica bacterium]|nr:class I SAM-dependent rRNA methyltransferase [Candidatus Omnitrophota bacterium]
QIFLKKDKEKPVRAFHPWIFSGAIDLVDDTCQPGNLVSIYAYDKSFLGIGYFNPKSQISVRMLTFQEEKIDSEFFKRRFKQSQEFRSSYLSQDTNCYRLIHAEGDFLPGLIVDRYDSFLVLQIQTLGMEHLKPLILEALQDSIPEIQGIYERSDSNARKLEGLEKSSKLLSGQEPPEFTRVTECGHIFLVDIQKGQKTGFFLDQRENRVLVGSIAHGKRVLNCFAYSGGFSIYAAKVGAKSVVSVDISKEAIELCRQNFKKNDLSLESNQFVVRDVFDYLREDETQYDLVILDPPAFCKTKDQVAQASRGYKDINLQAIKRIVPGGLLFTSSCSSYIDPSLFQKIIFGAAKDAKREVQILTKTSHPFDHPINVYHPEGEYLKGLLCRVL